MRRFCPKCGQDTNRKIIHTYCDPEVREYFAKNPDGSVKDRFWSVHIMVYNYTTCLGCDTPALSVEEYWPETTKEEYIRDIAETLKRTGECFNVKCVSRRNYPKAIDRTPPEWIKELPEHVMLLAYDVYNAVSQGLDVLAAMGIRALVDAVATHRIGDIGGFDKKLKELQTSGYLSKKELELLEAVVEVGHASSHRAYRPSHEDLIACLDLVEHVMETDFLAKSANVLKKKTPKRK